MSKPATRNPWAFIPTLYFGEGLPYILINTVSVILYKRMGIDNARIAFWTSLLYLPWVVKMFWGPLVDVYSTKRNWIVSAQVAMGLCLLLAAWTFGTAEFFFFSLLVFALGAFISATYDIAADGFYMLALTKEHQAAFVGLRAGFYRLAMVFGTGFLVFLAGTLELKTGNIPLSWTIIFSVAGAILVIAALYHRLILPYPAADGKQSTAATPGRASFAEVVRAYFRQERVGVVIAFILLYRLGEAMLLKLVAPFLLDAREAGGLGLTTSEVGVVYGTVGIICLVLGGVLGGWLISRYGLKRCIWPMVLIMHLPDLFFVYMAYAQPSVALAFPLVALEQFGYGLGFTVFTVYLMYSAEGGFKTSHYAISTGIMALGMMLPSAVSGDIQKAVGYKSFFIIVCFLTIPGMLTIPFLPHKEKQEH